MKTQETIIQELRRSMQDAPGAALEARVMRSAQRELAATAPARRGLPLKPALLLAALALVLLVTTTTFVYADVIKAFLFGDSSATQVETFGDNTASSFYIEGRIPEANDWPEGTVYEPFDSIAAANAVSHFPLHAPQYLPEGWALTRIDLLRFAEGQYGYDAILTFLIEYPSGGNAMLTLFQYYAGPDAHVVLETVYPIEKVMVGDAEASLSRNEDGGYELHWMQGDILYALHDSGGPAFDLETFLKIAESI